MRKLIITALAAISLAGCATVPGGTPALDPQAQAIINQVQATTKQICSFVPTASTIANIFATGIPIIGAVETIANGICSAVNQVPKLGRRGARRPVYRGVTIRGRMA